MPDCQKELPKVSPDHVGPLACGFKQLPFFIPTCPEHNSSKNRRLCVEDIQKLMAYEKKEKTSVASWQVRAHWDACKSKVSSNGQAVLLSHSMRSLQDFYLRVLHDLLEAGKARFLATLLHPEMAFMEVEFKGLNTSTLIFDSYKITPKITPSRQSLSARIVRIAFEELKEYTLKLPDKRKLKRKDYELSSIEVAAVLEQAKKNVLPDVDKLWDKAIRGDYSDEQREAKIQLLLKKHHAETHKEDIILRDHMQRVFDEVGNKISCF